ELAEHNLLTFKSHREALDGGAVRELVAHFVAYRKMVSRSPSEQLPEERFRLYAVAARFPHNLAGQVPWQRLQAGVYDCDWGTCDVKSHQRMAEDWPIQCPGLFPPLPAPW